MAHIYCWYCSSLDNNERLNLILHLNFKRPSMSFPLTHTTWTTLQLAEVESLPCLFFFSHFFFGSRITTLRISTDQYSSLLHSKNATSFTMWSGVSLGTYARITVLLVICRTRCTILTRPTDARRLEWKENNLLTLRSYIKSLCRLWFSIIFTIRVLSCNETILRRKFDQVLQ